MFAVSFREGTILQKWLESQVLEAWTKISFSTDRCFFFAARYPFCFRGKKCKEFTNNSIPMKQASINSPYNLYIYKQ